MNYLEELRIQLLLAIQHFEKQLHFIFTLKDMIYSYICCQYNVRDGSLSRRNSVQYVRMNPIKSICSRARFLYKLIVLHKGQPFLARTHIISRRAQALHAILLSRPNY